ncbi:MAG: c-type cytochrome [Campylobacterota bacterium]|nr:c-type cytochrome [Campylobacterota bacterium]
MKKALMISIITLSLISGAHATNATVESNKSMADKAGDLLGDLSNGTKELAKSVKDSTAPLIEETKDGATKLVEETKEGANKLVDAIKAKTNELLDTNSTHKINANALYSKCVGCHGSDGKTKALNKSPIIAGADYNATLTQLQGYQKGELDTAGMGRLMTTQVDGMKPEELEALAQYISTMKK